MTTAQLSLEPCHNCRRRRLKCDRSLPRCSKCTKTGQECLGYQRLFRWERGVASRGKMAGKTFEDMGKGQDSDPEKSDFHQLFPAGLSSQHYVPGHGNLEDLPVGSLTDPLFQDLSHTSRKYLSYFASDVCRDLVLYDSSNHNHFRELIPLSHRYPVLLHIMIANSALHMSNARQKLLSIGHRSPVCLRFSTIEQSKSYHDALAAKQHALSLLQSGLVRTASADLDVTLAVVLLFIELELIDSGRDQWKYHIKGARTMIETLTGTNNVLMQQTAMSPLRKSLIANCLVFDIIGSALSSPFAHDCPRQEFPAGNLSLLQDAEGNHCSSFPTYLLQLLRSGSASTWPDHHPLSASPGSHPSIDSQTQQQQQKEQILFLLSAAREFDPLEWAQNVQPHSPVCDLQYRVHIASAHRAGVCIYLSRILLSLSPTNTKLPQDLDYLVGDVITQLSCIPRSHALFKATTWPAFIAGAETNDGERQNWVVRRFEELWDVEPWGLIKGALGVLQKIWSNRMADVVVGDQINVQDLKQEHGNWIQDLRGRGVDWLVI